MANILNLEKGILNFIPDELRECNKIIREFDYLRCAYHHKVVELGLVNVSSAPEKLALSYTAPLREHGMRLNINFNKNTQELQFRIAWDGGNEKNRYEVVLNDFKNELVRKLGLEDAVTGSEFWSESELSSKYVMGWSSHEQLNIALDKLKKVLTHSINLTYKIMDGI